jgi:hypothetical protein
LEEKKNNNNSDADDKCKIEKEGETQLPCGSCTVQAKASIVNERYRKRVGKHI